MSTLLLRIADVFGAFGISERTFYAYEAVVEDVAWRFRRLDFVEVFAVVAGEGRQMTRTSSRVTTSLLTPGRMYFYRATDDIALRVSSPGGIRAIAVMIPRTEWDRFAEYAALDPTWSTAEEIPMATFDPGDDEALRPFEEAIARSRDVPTRFDLLRFLGDVIPRLLPVAGAPVPGFGAPAWLLEAVDALHKEENLRLGVPRLAELAHVSGPHLSASVRRHFGVTPTSLVNEMRLRHGGILLATTELAVGEIARRCGFATLSHFSNSFRAAQGSSPREYRRDRHALLTSA